MKKLLLLLLVVSSTAVFAQQLTWQFNNAQLVNGDTQLQFDVEVKADVAGTYALALTTVAFEYNTLGFGTNIYPGAVTVDRGTLLLAELAPGSYLNAVQGLANTFSNTFSVSTQTNFPGFNPAVFPAFYTFFPDVFTQMYTITIDILDPGQVAGIHFAEFLMNGQQFYQGNAVSVPMLDPCFYDNNLDDFPLGPVATANTWTNGTGDGLWETPGNWSYGTVPAGVEDVDIPDLGKAAPVVIAGSATVGGTLHIFAGAEVNIAFTGDLTTNGTFTNDGIFKILSDGGSGYAGSYIDNGPIGGTGSFEFNRDVLCSGTLPGVQNALGWHYLSAPIDGLTTDNMPDYFINAWNQGSGMWDQYFVDPIAFPCTPYPTTPLNVGEAWSINFDLSYPDPNCPLLPPGTGAIVEFTGAAAAVHTGLYSTPLGFGAGFQKWNLVGNPYPSGLDVDAITWGPNTVQTVHFYDGCNGNYVYWTAGAPGFGTANSSIMTPSMGFFVETTAADAFTVVNTDRAHGADWFWKSEVSSLLKLRASSNGQEDDLIVRFAEGATPGLDMQGDAHKLFATTAGLPQIYTVTNGEEFAINSLPAAETVPMGFKANGSGTYTIEAIETSEFSVIILEDLVTGETTDMLTSSYTFNYTEGSQADRFVIHFGPLGVDDNLAGNVSIWSNDHKIYVQTTNTDRGDIVVYNMMGQEVVRTDIAPGLNTIPMTEVNTYYVVKVLSNDSAVTGKVYIK